MLDIVFLSQMILLSLIESFTYVFIDARAEFLYLALFVDVVFIFMCVKYNIRIFYLGVFLPVAFAIYVSIFTVKWHVPLSIGQVGSYVALYSVGIFGVYARKRDLDSAMKMLFISSFIYVMLFLLIRYSIDPDEVIRMQRQFKGENLGFAMSHETREGVSNGQIRAGTRISFRIYISDFCFSLGLFYAWAKLRLKFSLTWLALFAVFAGSYAISDFRYQTYSAFAILAVSMLPIPMRLKVVSAAVFTTVAMLALLMLSSFGVNIYSPWQYDVSGSVRYDEAALAIKAFQENPLFGIGLPGNSDDLNILFGNRPIAPSDIGYLGMLFRFGVVGYIILWIGNVVIYRFAYQLVEAREGVSPAVKRTIIDLCIYATLISLTSTYLLEVGSRLFALAVCYAPVVNAARRRSADDGAGRELGMPSWVPSNTD